MWTWAYVLVHAVALMTPPIRDPPTTLSEDMKAVFTCAKTHTIGQLLPAIFYFVDVSSTYSFEQLVAFRDLAKAYSTSLSVIGILSFGRSIGDGENKPCSELERTYHITLVDDYEPQPPYQGTKTCLHCSLGMQDDDVMLFAKDGLLFRYVPRHKARMNQSTMYDWAKTMVEEFEATSADVGLSISNPLFLSDVIVKYSGHGIFDITPVKVRNQVENLDVCHDECLRDIHGCTGYETWGRHSCSFFTLDPAILRDGRESCSNSNLYVREPHEDVHLFRRISHGIFWVIFIVFVFIGAYTIYSKICVRRDRQGLTSLIQAAENSYSHEVERELKDDDRQFDRYADGRDEELPMTKGPE